MKPYYEEPGITLYCGDCREILPLLSEVDLVLTDPPYGIKHRRGPCSDRGKGITLGTLGIFGDEYFFDPTFLLEFPELILWGANWYADKLPPGRWLIWDKQENGGSGDFSEAEVAWHNKGRALKIFRHMWLGVQRASEIGAIRLHPTQKPIALFSWCLALSPASTSVLDPYMGSGATAVACKTLGKRFVGIEIEERYCEIAVKRLQQEVLPLESEVVNQDCSSPTSTSLPPQKPSHENKSRQIQANGASQNSLFIG